jgi:hypothetical protein
MIADNIVRSGTFSFFECIFDNQMSKCTTFIFCLCLSDKYLIISSLLLSAKLPMKDKIINALIIIV